MKKNKFIFGLLCILCINVSYAQLQRPKLVVGIVVDQMRWDYLYRYYNEYGDGGFKRMLNEGFSCANTQINYLPAYTAVGHTCIFTGSVPSLTGISGNNWISQANGQSTYCTDDSTVVSVGVDNSASGKMSPRNLQVTTITDELRLATNFQSKVIGISLKDRASILPAGHNPTGAYWLDDNSGKFITSTYYMSKLPDWVNSFNKEERVQRYMTKDWEPLMKINNYKESTQDNSVWEGKLAGADAPVFPYDLKKAYQKSKESFRNTPFGNSITLDFAEAAISGEQLGQRGQTDFLTINCASTDYVGHMVGTNAIEIEDVYLRLDKDLANFFKLLDNKLGKGNYLVFLTADHGGAHSEGFMEANKMPTGFFPKLKNNLNQYLNDKFKSGNLVIGLENDQINFENQKIETLNLDKAAIKKATIAYLEKQPGVLYAVDQSKVSEASIPEKIKEMIINGYNRQRSGDIKFILQSGWLPQEYKTGTTHGLWNPYDTHIPLLFMGWKIPHGESNRTIHMTDIAPTIASLLHIQMPSGSIGDPIESITGK